MGRTTRTITTVNNDSEEEAEYAGNYGLSCAKQGGEILEMSNPGDYPYDESDYEDDSFEVEEVD